MAKRSKKSEDPGSGETSAIGTISDLQSGGSSALSENLLSGGKAKSAAKSTRKRAAGSTPKSALSGKPRKPSARKKTPVESAISDEDVRLRAYFIAEHRMLSGVPGDSESDWLEARRQLLEADDGRA